MKISKETVKGARRISLVKARDIVVLGYCKRYKKENSWQGSEWVSYHIAGRQTNGLFATVEIMDAEAWEKLPSIPFFIQLINPFEKKEGFFKCSNVRPINKAEWDEELKIPIEESGEDPDF